MAIGFHESLTPDEIELHREYLKNLADLAMLSRRYRTPTYPISKPAPRHGVPIFCPDGRVLKAHSEADALALCYDLNNLLGNS